MWAIGDWLSRAQDALSPVLARTVRRPRVDWSLIWFCLSDLDPRSGVAWFADFPIRLISPCGLWSEPGPRWIVVSSDAAERGVDSGPQSCQARNPRQGARVTWRCVSR